MPPAVRNAPASSPRDRLWRARTKADTAAVPYTATRTSDSQPGGGARAALITDRPPMNRSTVISSGSSVDQYSSHRATTSAVTQSRTPAATAGPVRGRVGSGSYEAVAGRRPTAAVTIRAAARASSRNAVTRAPLSGVQRPGSRRARVTVPVAASAEAACRERRAATTAATETTRRTASISEVADRPRMRKWWSPAQYQARSTGEPSAARSLRIHTAAMRASAAQSAAPVSRAGRVTVTVPILTVAINRNKRFRGTRGTRRNRAAGPGSLSRPGPVSRHPHGRTLWSLPCSYIGTASVKLPAG